MLTEYKISDYTKKYGECWSCIMPQGCPPEDILVATEHPFYRMGCSVDKCDDEDFKSYAELNPQKDWGEMLPLAVGLSLIDNSDKAKKNLKLPLFKKYKGIIALTLNPTDGVVKQTGVHVSHYTWWRTTKFDHSNAIMLEI